MVVRILLNEGWSTCGDVFYFRCVGRLCQDLRGLGQNNGSCSGCMAGFWLLLHLILVAELIGFFLLA